MRRYEGLTLSSAPTLSWQFFTKWVPRPTRMDRGTVEAGVGQSLSRMKTEPLDLMQVTYTKQVIMCMERGKNKWPRGRFR